jgi:AraC-like DNA-binding protein
MYYARHAEMSIRTGGRDRVLPAGGFLLIPAQLHFHCHAASSATHLWVHFNMQPSYLHGFHQPMAVSGDERLQSQAEALWQAAANDCGKAAGQAMVHLVKSLLHALFAELDLATTSSVPPQLLRAVQFVQENRHRALTVADLARKSGYSPEHLAHLFRRYLGQSPSRFIRMCRIREAARRLAYTHDTLETIADDLAFANRHHLSRLFRESMGEPPVAFRRRVQASDGREG